MTPTYDGMFLGTAQEIKLFLLAAFGGVMLGAVYDTLRAFRLSVKHSKTAVFFQDVLFVLLAWLYCFSFCIELLDGQIRLFVAVGALAGFWAHRLTLGKLISNIYAKILQLLIKAARKIGNLLKKPWQKLCGTPFFEKIFKKIEKPS